MRSLTGRLAALLVVALTLACGSARSGGGSQTDRNLITRQQMLDGNFTSVYDAVQALRSNWLRPRGPDSFGASSEVWVYLGEVRLGSVETLRQLQPASVTSARFVDGPSAQGRWGMGHAAGVILISSSPEGSSVASPPDAGAGAGI